jgi:hypothetical protein
MSFKKRYFSSDTIKQFVEKNDIDGLEKNIMKFEGIITIDDISTETITIILDEDLEREKKHEMIRELFL